MGNVIVARRGPLVVFQRGTDGAAKVYVGNDSANAARFAGNAADSAALSGRYANNSTDTDVVGGSPGDRGARFYALKAQADGAAQVALATAQAVMATDLASGIGLSYSQMSVGRSPRIAPSATWNGTLGTGWSGGEPTASAVRLLGDLARPEIAPFYPYHRWAFNSRQRILFRLIEREPQRYPVNMRVHLEGNTLDIPNDTLQHYVGDDGIERTEWLRAFDLDWAAFSTNGKCRFYVEAIPSDPTMASVILGPYEMKRKTGNLWDATLTFGPGGTYSTFKAAYDALQASPFNNTSAYEHIWLKPFTSHDFDVYGAAAYAFDTIRWGKILVDGSPGITWRVHASAWSSGGASLFRPRMDGLVFGPSCQFDFRRMGSVQNYNSASYIQGMHFAGARLYNPNGRDDLFGTGGVAAANNGSTALTNPDQKAKRNVHFLASAGANGPKFDMTECVVEGCARAPMAGPTQIARNNTVRGCSEDVFSPGVYGQFGFCYGNVVYDASPITLRAGVNAISIIYGGAATTATVEFFGANDTAGNRIYLRENGTIAYTVVVSITLGSGNYSVADVVAWINANCAGWTAVTLDNSRRASYFSAKAAANAKSIAVINTTVIDNHSDGWQTSSAPLRNYIAERNQLFNAGALQVFFLSIQSALVIHTDCVWQNNLIHNDPNDAEVVLGNTLSQLEGRFSNVRLLNNYNLQGFNIRTQSGTTSFDDKCAIEGNIHTTFALEAGTSLGACSVRYNQAMSAGATYPAGTNVNSNLVSTSLSADPIPAKPRYDINGETRTALSRRGTFR